MTYFTAAKVKETLLSSIQSLLDRRDEFLVNPKSAFTRVKKISFEQTILFPMVAESNNVATELIDLFGERNLPLPSAMIQRRNQVKTEAFLELFYHFTAQLPKPKTFHGFKLVAHDGTRLNVPYNPLDPFSFRQLIQGRKGINQVHMNALYDVLNDVFLDAEVQGFSQLDEVRAFCTILDRQKDMDPSQKRIYIADRGFASYNVFAHAIHNHQFFLIRVPEDMAKTICMDQEHWMEDSYVDEEISVHIGRRRSKKLRQLENYHWIPASRHYDFVDPGSYDYDSLQLRVVKFPISDHSFEYIVTNIPKYAFSSRTIKELYGLRWREETAFRYLKYAGDMVHIHSLKKEFLLQEIFAKLTVYNFSASIGAAIVCEKTKKRKYDYVINHSQSQKICFRYLRGTVKNVSALIARYIVPVRPGRKFKRNLRTQSVDTLHYR